MHDEIARLSTRGSNQIVPGAGHDIHVDNPGAVVEAVVGVLNGQ
jgi:pimeloyl-ACP methyl ester carboxylesterase